VATRTEHLPVDFELYLPECWANDAARRREARIPADVPLKTKPQLALQMIDRAVEDRVPPGVVLADTAYGSCSHFRAHLRSRGLHSAAATPFAASLLQAPQTARSTRRAT
jgi:SRSO17 transposase